MIIKMLKKERRPYILRSERPGFFEKRIETVQKELEALGIDKYDEIEQKKNDLEALETARKETAEKLEKYGPTTWELENVSKKAVLMGAARLNIDLVSSKQAQVQMITSGQMAYHELQRIVACEQALKGWDNLIDQDGNKIAFDKNLIELLPKDIQVELGSEALGELTDEDSKN